MARPLNSLIGNRYGLWTVVEQAPRVAGVTMWLCRCDCGDAKVVRGPNLKNGRSLSCGCGPKKPRQKRPEILPGDRPGLRFGRLVVRGHAGGEKWLCDCDCGEVRAFRWGNLRAGIARSCGCLRKEVMSARFFKHGRIHDGIYHSWQAMKDRCLNRNNQDYHRYGGRGIRICDRWLESFDNFLADMEAGWASGLTIERVDNDGDYEPGNCVWIPNEDQAKNRGGKFAEARP
jgi:hypothetical protein